MNWKEYERKRSWSTLRCYPGICVYINKTAENLSQCRSRAETWTPTSRARIGGDENIAGTFGEIRIVTWLLDRFSPYTQRGLPEVHKPRVFIASQDDRWRRRHPARNKQTVDHRTSRLGTLQKLSSSFMVQCTFQESAKHILTLGYKQASSLRN